MKRRSRRPTQCLALVCRACSSDAVAIAERREHGRAHWWLQIRCGACGSWRETLLPRVVFAPLERMLESDRREIAATAARLERERVEEEVGRFSAAIDAVVLPV